MAEIGAMYLLIGVSLVSFVSIKDVFHVVSAMAYLGLWRPLQRRWLDVFGWKTHENPTEGAKRSNKYQY